MAHRSALKVWRPQGHPWPESLTKDAIVPSWFGKRFRDFRANLALGFKAMANTWVITLVPSLLMLFSWEAGWDNSFNKGYEQAALGPTTGLMGIGLFIVAMFYLPMAQARLAISRESRTFYHFKHVRAVVRRQWWPCLLLALGYATLSLPIMVLGSYLGLAAHETDITKPSSLSQMAPTEALAFLNRYFLFCCAYVFPAYLALRCWGARIYARGALACLQTGRWSQEDLTTGECQAFEALDLAQHVTPPERRVLWLGNQGLRIAAGTLAVVIWFSVSAQTYVTQFFAYQPMARWMNQPLIQLPWYRHIPKALKVAVEEEKQTRTPEAVIEAAELRPPS